MSHSRRLARNVEQYRIKHSSEPAPKRVRPGTQDRRVQIAGHIAEKGSVYEIRAHRTKGLRVERMPGPDARPFFVPPPKATGPIVGDGQKRAAERMGQKLTAEAARVPNLRDDSTKNENRRAAIKLRKLDAKRAAKEGRKLVHRGGGNWSQSADHAPRPVRIKARLTRKERLHHFGVNFDIETENFAVGARS